MRASQWSLRRPRTVMVASALVMGGLPILPAQPASAGSVAVGPGWSAVTAVTVQQGLPKRVLLFGDNATAPLESSTGPMAGVAEALARRGFAVEKASFLPDDLTGYGQVWSVTTFRAPDAADQMRLVDFVHDGGGLLLMGERDGCCQAVNLVDKAIIDQLVAIPGGLQFGPSDLRGDQINPTAMHGAATTPANLTVFTTASSGSIDTRGLPRRNFLAFKPSLPYAASIGIWDRADLATGAGGRVALVMDISWAQSTIGHPRSVRQVGGNLATFLARQR